MNRVKELTKIFTTGNSLKSSATVLLYILVILTTEANIGKTEEKSFTEMAPSFSEDEHSKIIATADSVEEILSTTSDLSLTDSEIKQLSDFTSGWSIETPSTIENDIIANSTAIYSSNSLSITNSFITNNLNDTQESTQILNGSQPESNLSIQSSTLTETNVVNETYDSSVLEILSSTNEFKVESSSIDLEENKTLSTTFPNSMSSIQEFLNQTSHQNMSEVETEKESSLSTLTYETLSVNVTISPTSTLESEPSFSNVLNDTLSPSMLISSSEIMESVSTSSVAFNNSLSSTVLISPSEPLESESSSSASYNNTMSVNDSILPSEVTESYSPNSTLYNNTASVDNTISPTETIEIKNDTFSTFEMFTATDLDTSFVEFSSNSDVSLAASSIFDSDGISTVTQDTISVSPTSSVGKGFTLESFSHLRAMIIASIYVDPCLENSCLNGGLCIANLNSTFQCICPRGWMGQNCSIDVNECESANNCNIDTTTCVNIPGYYMCQCKQNYHRIGEFNCRRIVVWPYALSKNSSRFTSDDEIEGPFIFEKGFPFFGKFFSSIYISMNGYITFDEKIGIINPYSNNFFPETLPFLAIYWTDIDSSAGNGSLYVDHLVDFNTTYGQDIMDRLNISQVPFEPTEVLIATWENVSPYPQNLYSDQNATFQVIIATDLYQSYAIFNYEQDRMLWSPKSQPRRFTVGAYDGLKKKIPLDMDFYRPDLYSNIDVNGTFHIKLGNSSVRYDVCENLKSLEFASYSCPCNRALAELDKEFKLISNNCFDSVFSKNQIIQKCCYDGEFLLQGYPDGGYPRQNKNEENLKDKCCQEKPSCANLYKSRPSDTCKDYNPPKAAGIFSCSNITNFDGISYTLNSSGEYDFYKTNESWENDLNIQVRFQSTADLKNNSCYLLKAIVVQGLNSPKIEVRASSSKNRVMIAIDDQSFDEMNKTHPNMKLNKKEGSIELFYKKGTYIELKILEHSLNFFIESKYNRTDLVTGLVNEKENFMKWSLLNSTTLFNYTFDGHNKTFSDFNKDLSDYPEAKIENINITQSETARTICSIFKPCYPSVVCTDETNGYQCGSCPAGMKGTDGIKCFNEDQCAIRNPCEQHCQNNETSYICSCSPGYNQVGHKCTDINECTEGWKGEKVCTKEGEYCTNSLGSYSCHCRAQWFRNGDNICQKISKRFSGQVKSSLFMVKPGVYLNWNNNMKTSDSQDFQIMKRTIESNSSDISLFFKSKYEKEFSGILLTSLQNGSIIVKFDILFNDLNNQDLNATSISKDFMSYTQHCHVGDGPKCIRGEFYGLDKSATTAGAKDLCIKSSDNDCDYTSTNCSTNEYGSFLCTCKTGYEAYKGQSNICKDINECLREDQYICPANSTCLNLPGSFKCPCNPSYKWNAVELSCDKLCHKDTCKNGGECKKTDDGESIVCKCTKDWKGPFCEEEIESSDKWKTITIAVGAALGGICFLFLIIIICICVRHKKEDAYQHQGDINVEHWAPASATGTAITSNSNGALYDDKLLEDSDSRSVLGKKSALRLDDIPSTSYESSDYDSLKEIKFQLLSVRRKYKLNKQQHHVDGVRNPAYDGSSVKDLGREYF
ncbi:DgyrCDS11033 [Dimorphilus gyrociliatus]|uniref:DgyrCDS11033 n=1 Tax=Dimorphilus gyrociliatus TaxID=2664684 RepID=A0A7I8W3G5_9ANNE|nr:DgyrCDS11033 [Dimorphilus gyrociliatus]